MTALYPAASYAASRFGPTETSEAQGTSWDRAAAGLSRAAHVLVVCPRPIESFIELVVLHGIVAAVRQSAPSAQVTLCCSCPLPNWSALEALSVHRIQDLPSTRTFKDRLECAATMARLPKGAFVLVGPTWYWRLLARVVAGTSPIVEVPFDTHPWGSKPPEHVIQEFHRAALAASPHWEHAPDAPKPANPLTSILIHQGRFHLGDTLWLTPLLRAIRKLLPEIRVVVATTPSCARLLEGNPHVTQVLSFSVGPEDRAIDPPVAALEAARFDAAIFAFGRRPSSFWLACAAERLAIPTRINLEFRAHGMAPGPGPRPFTHEAWFFWGAMRHPRVLLHSLLPLSPASADLLDDLLPDYMVPIEAQRTAQQILETSARNAASLVVMAPAALASEAWPGPCFAALARWLVEQHAVSVLLVGGPKDKELLSDVRGGALSELREPLHQRIRIVQEPLPVFAALIRAAQLVVANDSVAIHFADCFGVPTLYFSRHEYLPHSHPIRPTAWALFDDSENRVSNISVTQAMGAIESMIQTGLVHFGGVSTLAAG